MTEHAAETYGPPSGLSGDDRLSHDQLFVLCHWAVQAAAAELGVDYDDANDLLGAADSQGRVQVLGNAGEVGVACDGRWLVVVPRAWLAEATREWTVLRAVKHALDG